MGSDSSSSVSGQVWPSLVPAGERAGKPSVELARAVVLLGSEPYNHIRMASSTVSRSHALILNSDGGSYIRDLMSRSGLLVNGEQVREKALFDGDEVRIGRFSFVFQAGVLPERDVELPAGHLKIGNFVLPLNQRVVVIGRRAGCDLILENDLVSTVHAVIFTMNGKHVLRDLNSKNGTRVDGKKIHQVELKTSDVIRVGGTEIVYTAGGARTVRPGDAPMAVPSKPAAPAAPGRAAAAAALEAASEAATAPEIDDELLPPVVAASAGAGAAALSQSPDDDFDFDELLGGDGQTAAPGVVEEDAAPAASAAQEPAERAMTQPSEQLQVNEADLIPVEREEREDLASATPAAQSSPEAELTPGGAADEGRTVVEAELPLPVEDEVRAEPAEAAEPVVTPTPMTSADVSSADDAMPWLPDDTETTGTREVESSSASIELPPPLPVDEPQDEPEGDPVAEAWHEDARLEDPELSPFEPAPQPQSQAVADPVELARPEPPEVTAAAPIEEDGDEEEFGAGPIGVPAEGDALLEEGASARALDMEEIERARNTPAAEPISAPEAEAVVAEAPPATTRGGAAPEPVMSQQADAAETGDIDIADSVAAESDDMADMDYAEEVTPVPGRATVSGEASEESLSPDVHERDETDVTVTPMELAGAAITGAAAVTEEPAAVNATFDEEQPAIARPTEEQAELGEALDETVTGSDSAEAAVDVEEAAQPVEDVAGMEAPTVAGSARGSEVDGAPAAEPRESERAADEAVGFLNEPPAAETGEREASLAEEQRPAVLLMDEVPQAPLSDEDVRDDVVHGVDMAETLTSADALDDDAPPDVGEAVMEDRAPSAVAEPFEESPTDVAAAEGELPGPVGEAMEAAQPTLSEEAMERARDEAAPLGDAEGFDGEPPQDAPAFQDESVGDEAAASEPVGGAAPTMDSGDEYSPKLLPDEALPPSGGGEVTIQDVEPPRSPQPVFVTMSDRPGSSAATPPGMFFVTVGGGMVPAAPAVPQMPPRVQVVQLPLETPRPVGMPPTPPRPPQATARATISTDLGRPVGERAISRTSDDSNDLDTGHEMIDEDALGLLDDPLEVQDSMLLDDEAANALHAPPKGAPPAPAPKTEQPPAADIADDAPFDDLLDETSDDAMQRAGDEYDDPFATTARPLTEGAAAQPPEAGAGKDGAAARAREESRKRLRDTVSSQDSVVDVFALHADLQPPETEEAAEALETTGLPDRQRMPSASPPSTRHVPPNPAKWGPVAGAVAESMLDARDEPSAAPASPKKRLARILVVMVIAMILAAAAIWKFVLPYVLVEATMPFARLADIDANERMNVQDEQLELLRDPHVRRSAVGILHIAAPSAPAGFLNDTDALFTRLAPRWVVRDPEKMALVVKFQGIDREHDGERLGALLEAVYRDERNQRRHRESNVAQRRLEARRTAVKLAQQELADLKQKEKQYQALGNQRPDPSVLASLRQTAERLEADWNRQVTGRKELQAELGRMQQSLSGSTSPPAADASAAEKSDSEFARMVQDLEEKKRRLEELGSGLGSKATAARRELADAVDEFQSTIKAMQEMMKDNPALSDYVASAQQLHEAAWKFQGDLIERQEKQQQRLVDYKRRLEEQMERRRQEVIANDPDMKELNGMLDLNQREYSAAEQSGLKKEAAKVKEKIDYLKQQIDARQRMLGQDSFYSDAIAELKGIIDNVEKQLAADRERSERTMADLETKFRLRNSEVERMPQAQRALAGKLAERATMIQQARKAYADATAERDVDANDQLKRLQSEVAALEGRVAARRREILEDLQKRMGEQQQQEIQRMQSRIAEAEQAEQAAMEAHSRALKAHAEADALQRRWAESGGEYEALLRELPQAERRVIRADEDLAADERALKNVVTPLAPSKAQIVGYHDRRRSYTIWACLGIAMFAGAYWAFTGGLRGWSRQNATGFEVVPRVSEKDQEVTV